MPCRDDVLILNDITGILISFSSPVNLREANLPDDG